MFIDSIVVVLLVLAVIKGYSKGLIIAVFSFFSVIIGLAAAIKLSAVVANRLSETTNINARWLPILSFALVMFVVVLLVRWGAKAVEKTASIVLMGWANKLGGIILFALLYLTVFSVVLFLAEKINMVKPQTIADSKCYGFVHLLGPKAIDAFGYIVPLFKGLFTQLEIFFDSLSTKIK